MFLENTVGRLRDLAEFALILLPGLLLGLLVLGLFIAVGRGVQAGMMHAAERRGHGRGVGIVLGRVGYGFCLLLGILIGTSIAFPTVGAADLLSLLGIGGVAIGFAFRDILQNSLAGVLILLTRPFRIGDQVVAGGYEGTVEDIQVRATTIRTYDNRRAVIPNTDLFTDKVLVNTAYERRRLKIRIGIGYGDDIALAKQVMERAAHSASGVLADPPPRALVAELGDSAILIDLYVWIDPPQRAEALEVIDQVLERVKPALVQAGVDLPYPTTQVLFHDQTEATDGERARQREGWPSRGQDDPAPLRLQAGDEGKAPAPSSDSHDSPMPKAQGASRPRS
jgi:small-conductance mechanosensitive channel